MTAGSPPNRDDAIDAALSDATKPTEIASERQLSLQDTAILDAPSADSSRPRIDTPAPRRPGTETVHLHVGEVWGGDFELGPLIGRGGMGAVYAGRQLSLERAVAIKALRAHLCEDEELVARFEQEAKWLARISSPHVIQVHAFGRHRNHHFLVMELIEGEDLNKKIKGGWRPGLDETLGLMVQAARGLGAAAEHGIVHRDIKPGNMLLTLRGELKLTDFGLARLVHGSSAISTTGVVLGTDSYMSPEQCQGRAVDPRSDIYSLGVVFYELLTGTRPFVGETHMEVFCQHIEQPPRPPRLLVPSIPAAVEAVVLTCLEKRPERRYQSPHDLLADLERLIAKQAPRATVRRPRRLGRYIAAAFALLCAAACWWTLVRPDRTVASAPSAPTPPAPPPQVTIPPAPPGPRQVAINPTPAGSATGSASSPGSGDSLAKAAGASDDHERALAAAAGAALAQSSQGLPANRTRKALAEAVHAARGDEPWYDQARNRLSELPDTTDIAKPPWAAACAVDDYGMWATCSKNGYEQRFRWCPGGRFPERDPARAIARDVTIDHGFWLADTETTVRQWLAVRRLAGTPSDLPVTEVSWDEAAAFCVALRDCGVQARLPSEAEWMYACRAGRDWTADEVARRAWTRIDASAAQPVHSRANDENPWGLCDMFGNVSEWCSDWNEAWGPGAAIDPSGPPAGTEKVAHGGDFLVGPADCLPEARVTFKPFTRMSNLGFRALVEP